VKLDRGVRFFYDARGKSFFLARVSGCDVLLLAASRDALAAKRDFLILMHNAVLAADAVGLDEHVACTRNETKEHT
jgi:hypothetical protein